MLMQTAPVEQLALRFASCSVLPMLDFITRAEEHSCNLVLKNAAEDCLWLYNLFLGRKHTSLMKLA